MRAGVDGLNNEDSRRSRQLHEAYIELKRQEDSGAQYNRSAHRESALRDGDEVVVAEFNADKTRKMRLECEALSADELCGHSPRSLEVPLLNAAAAGSWLYPANVSLREYQIDIARTCLFQVLFIAA